MLSRIVGWILAVLLAAPVWAGVEVQFPLKGYYRPGRYMPVEVRAATNAALRIGATDTMATEITPESGGIDGVVPLLAADGMSDAYWQIKSEQGKTGGRIEQSFRSLGPDERLVGFTTIDMAIGHELFKDKQIIPIKLDAANPVAGTATAWETLDAVVVDAGARLEAEKIDELLACGVTIAVRGTDRPDRRVGWRAVGGYWVAERAIAGPTAGGMNSAAFLPVAGWEAEWPVAFRKRIFLVGVVFGVLVVGISLMSGRWAGIGIVGLSGIFVAGLTIWWSGRSPIIERMGTIMVVDEKGAQSDEWTFVASPSARVVEIAWSAVMHPFFETRNPRLVLECGARGRPSGFRCEVEAGAKYGFLRRGFGIAAKPVAKIEDSALMPLVREMYLTNGASVVGQIEATSSERSNVETWPTIVMKR